MDKFDFGTGENVFFTSDTHFEHSNIINFCSRPFKNTEEMDNAIIDNWNSCVGEDDIIFHLGDVSYHSSNNIQNILKRLNGTKYLILGNHDSKYVKIYSKYFKEISYQMRINIDSWLLYLNHFPFLALSGTYSNLNLEGQAFGHVHYGPNSTGKDTERLKYLFPNQYDVGVDNNNYTPISWKTLKSYLLEQRKCKLNMIDMKLKNKYNSKDDYDTTSFLSATE